MLKSSNLPKKSENLQGIRLLVYHVVKKVLSDSEKVGHTMYWTFLDLEIFEPFKI
jgi:hypothetical protein